MLFWCITLLFVLFWVWGLYSVGFCVLRFCCVLCCDCCASLVFGLVGLGVVVLRLLVVCVCRWLCCGIVLVCCVSWFAEVRFSGYLGSCVCVGESLLFWCLLCGTERFGFCGLVFVVYYG